MQVSICVSATCAISDQSGRCSNTFARLEYVYIVNKLQKFKKIAKFSI